MPLSEKELRTLAYIALSIKEGKTPTSYSAEAAKKAEDMSVEQLYTAIAKMKSGR
tara:strand:- start:4851 stop:5015 length:165 start_codon:yes stop_codon:yes gene_type:complete